MISSIRLSTRLSLLTSSFAIYLWYQGAVISASLVFSYLGSNFLCNIARHHCRVALMKAAAESELVLVWLFRKDSLVADVRSSAAGAAS
jgi:hypothetical protein